MTGDLADALDRDLRSDRLTFDELSWRGLWAYITTAPPGTAIFHHLSEGWTIGDMIAAEQLYEQRKLGWRYTAMHFKGGKDVEFPEPVKYPGNATVKADKQTQPRTLNDVVPPHVRKLLRGA